MDELGNLLREAREARGLSLADAQEATRINSRYLQALEEGQYGSLPSQVHVRGYLRNYAKFLSLDPNPILSRFELNRTTYTQQAVQVEEEEISASRPLPTREDRVFFDPVNMEVGATPRGESSPLVRIIIIIALLIAIGLIGMRVYSLLAGDEGGAGDLTAALEQVVSEITNNEPADEAQTPSPTLIPAAAEPITSTSRNTAIQLPTPTATRPTLPATLETIRMRLEVTERSWMRVTIDDEVVFQGIAKSGDPPYEYEAQDSAILLTGNGIGIFVTINDVPLGRLGGRGEVVEETWLTTSTQ